MPAKYLYDGGNFLDHTYMWDADIIERLLRACLIRRANMDDRVRLESLDRVYMHSSGSGWGSGKYVIATIDLQAEGRFYVIVDGFNYNDCELAVRTIKERRKRDHTEEVLARIDMTYQEDA